MTDSQIAGWMDKYGWERNPFTFRIYPDLMTGYESEHQRIRDAIESNSKFTLLLGRTGAGKTNMMRRVEQEYDNDLHVFYMSKPPVTEEDLLEYMRQEVLQQGVIAKLIKSYSLYNIHDALNAKYDGQTVLLVDEGHEASVEVLEWLRTAMDHIDNMTVVAAGLPEFETKLTGEVNTLYSRATDVVHLQSLDRDDTIELIRRRIEHVGGRSIEPFTQEALLKVYEDTAGFPRDVLRVCNECVLQAAKNDKSIIDPSDVAKVIDGRDTGEGPSHTDESSGKTNSPGGREPQDNEAETAASSTSAQQDEQPDTNDEQSDEGDEDPYADTLLTDKQESIFEAVEELGEASSGDIVEHMGMEDYKSRSHAIRSINNILRRLMEQDLIVRRRKGRNYLYRVDGD